MNPSISITPLVFWVGAALSTVFALLALLHLNWVLGGSFASAAAVPERPIAVSGSGKTERVNAFKPSKAATLAVAGALLAVAGLVALRTGLFGMVLTHGSLRAAIGLVGLIMLTRAIGDFQLVGFFKTITDSSFARLDTWLYSPICVALGLGLGVVARA